MESDPIDSLIFAFKNIRGLSPIIFLVILKNIRGLSPITILILMLYPQLFR